MISISSREKITWIHAITYPRDETLVETRNTSSTPNGLNGLEHRLSPVGGHLRLEHFQWLTQCRDFLLLESLQKRGTNTLFNTALTNCTLNPGEPRKLVSKGDPQCMRFNYHVHNSTYARLWGKHKSRRVVSGDRLYAPTAILDQLTPF